MNNNNLNYKIHILNDTWGRLLGWGRHKHRHNIKTLTFIKTILTNE